MKSETVSFADTAQKLLLLIRSVFSLSAATDTLLRRSDFQKSIFSSIENVEEVKRLGESYRSFADAAEIEARPFASRIFYRAVETMMNIWDWLRGKIREANNVVTLYCPVWMEVELECRI